MYKQIYDLTMADLGEFPVWYFPMDDTVEDELSIKPLDSGNALFPDFRVIVKTHFYDSMGKLYLGYIYWCKDNSVNACQPVLFVNENTCISFWNGIVKPSWDVYGELPKTLRGRFPIRFESEEHYGLGKVDGTLKGLYYIDDNDRIQCI